MIRQQWAVLRRILLLCGPLLRRNLWFALGAAFFPVFYNLIMATTLKNTFAALPAPQDENLSITILLFALSMIVLFLYNGFTWGLVGPSVVRITGHIRKALFQHLCRLTVGTLEQGHSADVLTHFSSDILAVERIYGYILRWSMAMILSGIVSTAIIFKLSWVLGLAILMTALLQVAVSLCLIKPLQRLSRDIAQNIQKTTAAMVNIIDGSIIIRLYGATEQQLAGYEKLSLGLARLNKRKGLIDGIIKGGGIVSGMGGYLLLLAVGSHMIAQGTMDLPQLLFISQMRGLMMQVVVTVGDFAMMVQPGLAAGERLLQFLDQPTE